MRAGYSVVVIDAFSDAQTVALAKKTIVVRYGNAGFDADGLLQALHALNDGVFSLTCFAGFSYGSGFEAQPALLRKVISLIPVIGNSAKTLSAVKKSQTFFSVLRQLEVKHPETLAELPPSADFSQYLRKCSGGSGGVHVHPATSLNGSDRERYYFQRKLDGLPISLLFVANGQDIEVVGFNEQWVNANERMPFRYGGAVSHVALSTSVQRQLFIAAKKITVAFKLLGLNSLDAILHISATGAEEVQVLEVNPRLSATVDLYDQQRFLFERHIQACLYGKLGCGKSLQLNVIKSKLHQDAPKLASKAHAIVYADSDVEIMADMVWPSWVTDSPVLFEKPLKFMSGKPVCSVFSYAEHAEMAKTEVLLRVEQVKSLLKLIN